MIELFAKVSGEPSLFAAADLIIESLGLLPEEEREQYRPTPTARAVLLTSPTVEVDQARGQSAEPKDEVQPALPQIEDLADFLARDLPKPLELIEGILYQGSKMILASGSKSYKTWTLLGLGLSVAYGLEWLGFGTKQGAVLYVNLEIQEPFLVDRVRTVAEAKSISPGNGHFDVYNLRGYAVKMAELLPLLLARIGTKKYALIILDPIYKVLGGRDENDAGHMATVLNDLERLAVRTGAAVVFAGHYSKGNQAGKASIDRMSGSGVFARDSDTILTLTQHEETDAFSVEATLRNQRRIESFVVRWEYPVMVRDEALNPSKLRQAKGRPTVHTTDDLLKVLGDAAMSYKIWAAAAKEQAGIGPTIFKNLLAKLKAGGKVEQDKFTQAYIKAGKV